MERLLKIQALAERGSPGERENAKRMLDELCAEHGISVESLLSPEIKWHDFKVLPIHNDLFIQCACHVLKKNSIQMSKVRRGEQRIEMTAADAIDLQDCFTHYRNIWEDELKVFEQAFYGKHRIFSGVTSGDADDDPMDPVKLARLLAMMQGIGGTKWQKPTARLTA